MANDYHVFFEYKYVTEDSVEKDDHYFGIEVTKKITL